MAGQAAISVSGLEHRVGGFLRVWGSGFGVLGSGATQGSRLRAPGFRHSGSQLAISKKYTSTQDKKSCITCLFPYCRVIRLPFEGCPKS